MRFEAIRIFIDFASLMEFKLYQVTVKCAFRNRFLEGDVYVEQLPCFENHDFLKHFYKHDKALYGIKQAPREWYERLSKFLLKEELTY